MNRRDALNATMTLIGSAIIGGQAFLAGCKPSGEKVTGFTNDLLVLLDELGETILPSTTASPGAKAARIGAFMKVIVSDCYDKTEQKAFLDGLNALQKMVSKRYNKSFLQLSSVEKNKVLSILDQESREAQGDEHPHIFEMLHQLTVWGYFSSEPGVTKALRYIPIPGKYDGCIPYKDGEGAWAY